VLASVDTRGRVEAGLLQQVSDEAFFGLTQAQLTLRHHAGNGSAFAEGLPVGKFDGIGPATTAFSRGLISEASPSNFFNPTSEKLARTTIGVSLRGRPPC
jgi:hypothetical protein